MGIIRRKAIEKPTTGIGNKPRVAPGARPQPQTVEEWVNRGPDTAVVKAVQASGTPAPAAPSAPAPATPAAGSTSSASNPATPDNLNEQRVGIGHRRRSRRRTGEVPVSPESASPSMAAGQERDGTTVDPPAPAAPEAGAIVAPAVAATVTAGPASPLAAAGGNGRRGTLTGRASHHVGPEQQEVHGELRALKRDRSITPLPAHMPKVLVDLGELEPTATEPAQISEAAPAVPAFEAIPVPIIEENNLASPPVSSRAESTSLGDTQPLPSPPPVTVLAPTPEAVPPASRDTAGVRSAEIDTGLRRAPSPELLEAPPSGPSIMLDPHLIAEMDAFELANSPQTPPPQVVSPPPVAAEPPRPAPAAAAPAAGAIVSFVKGPANASPHAGLNSAPTVPMSPVTTHAGGGGAVPVAHAAGGTPAEGISKRRVSGEFNELEADFFAREKDLYQGANEPAESFDDLVARDPGKDPARDPANEPVKNEPVKNGLGPGPRKS
jgi:hypothetical protein